MTPLATVEDALRLSPEEVSLLHRQYLNPALVHALDFLGMNGQFTEAYGATLRGTDGEIFLDFKGGYGSLNTGHNHPEILKALTQVFGAPNFLQASLSRLAAVLAKNLALLAPGDLQHSFFCNSGAEAVEGALKTAVLYTKRSRVLSTHGSFHGKTLGAVSVTGNPAYRKGVGLRSPEVVHIPFNDLEALARELARVPTAAFIVEPIQGEGGIKVPSFGYLSRARELCTKHGALLIVDEVQTGFGRTGKMFACDHEGVSPDIMCVAKSLGGGVMPIGAFMTTRPIWMKCFGTMDTFALHTSTFGGNALACAAGIATLNVIQGEGLCAAAAEKGSYLLQELKGLQQRFPDVIRDVRGQGLLIGIELGHWAADLLDLVMTKSGSQLLGCLVAGQLFSQHRILTVYTLNRPNVIRVEPPLNVTNEELAYFLRSLTAVLEAYPGFLRLALRSLSERQKLIELVQLMSGRVPIPD